MQHYIDEDYTSDPYWNVTVIITVIVLIVSITFISLNVVNEQSEPVTITPEHVYLNTNVSFDKYGSIRGYVPTFTIVYLQDNEVITVCLKKDDSVFISDKDELVIDNKHRTLYITQNTFDNLIINKEK